MVLSYPEQHIFYPGNVFITIGIIKGFIIRSTIAWHFAKVMNILGILSALYLGAVLLFSSPIVNKSLVFIWGTILVSLIGSVYVLYVLFSPDVRSYFTDKETDKPDE